MNVVESLRKESGFSRQQVADYLGITLKEYQG